MLGCCLPLDAFAGVLDDCFLRRARRDCERDCDRAGAGEVSESDTSLPVESATGDMFAGLRGLVE
jgi:hypothetical protein